MKNTINAMIAFWVICPPHDGPTDSTETSLIEDLPAAFCSAACTASACVWCAAAPWPFGNLACTSMDRDDPVPMLTTVSPVRPAADTAACVWAMVRVEDGTIHDVP